MSYISNPVIPYNGPIHGGSSTGRFIQIEGSTFHHTHRFAVNLICGSYGDILLHVSPNFNEHRVNRNSVLNQIWGHDESHGHFPLRRGEPFTMSILIEPSCYRIQFNGSHFADFHHRSPHHRATNLSIDGGVSIYTISYEGSGHSAPYVPPAYTPSPPVVYAPPPVVIGSPAVVVSAEELARQKQRSDERAMRYAVGGALVGGALMGLANSGNHHHHHHQHGHFHGHHHGHFGHHGHHGHHPIAGHHHAHHHQHGHFHGHHHGHHLGHHGHHGHHRNAMYSSTE